MSNSFMPQDQAPDVLARLLNFTEGKPLNRSQVIDLHWEDHNVLLCEFTSLDTPSIIVAVMRKGKQLLGFKDLNDHDYDTAILEYECQALSHQVEDRRVVTH